MRSITVYELKRLVKTKTDSCFFNKDTMKFFGDTLNNYKVSSAIVNTCHKKGVKCWKLSRKKAVKNGLKNPAYFDKLTLSKINPLIM